MLTCLFSANSSPLNSSSKTLSISLKLINSLFILNYLSEKFSSLTNTSSLVSQALKYLGKFKIQGLHYSNTPIFGPFSFLWISQLVLYWLKSPYTSAIYTYVSSITLLLQISINLVFWTKCTKSFKHTIQWI